MLIRIILVLVAALHLVSVSLCSTRPCGPRYKAPPPLDRIAVTQGRYVDTTGRERYFHGVNSVLKREPWYDARLVDASSPLIDRWAGHGFNVVRLGVMWSGVQPVSAASYSSDYLTNVSGIVDALAERGFFTIVDMHQDVASKRYGSYDGLPAWWVNSLPPPRARFPFPLIRVDVWQAAYLAEAVGQAFQSLYDHPAPLAHYWTLVSDRFRGRSSVLGYELINEPWAGDIYKHPQLLMPGIAGSHNLAPLYEKLSAAIRLVDNATMIFYEPVTWAILETGPRAGTGFVAPPGHDLARTSLSFHYYCWFYDPKVATFVRLCDRWLAPKIINTIAEDLRTMGGAASFLTEFGLCNVTSASTTTYKECEAILTAADAHLTSWTYWGDIPAHDDAFVGTFARIYARAVAGHLTSGVYDAGSRSYNATITTRYQIEAPTEIVVPRLLYADESWFNVKVTSDSPMQWYYRDGVVYLQSCHAARENIRFNIIIHSI